ncbi:hypothetical protein COLO4_19959 [Corchorus olitorius]|uniref:Uncharacterized protein n=1 Tax=Corchorus olitorius TaxID=93759 RepID=A0A1R3J2M1_9ROSI|nr:hypothetical protein COLO4_19959 [Corchorus olitorius]
MIRGRKVSRGSMDREIIDGEERIVHGREWCRICVANSLNLLRSVQEGDCGGLDELARWNLLQVSSLSV